MQAIILSSFSFKDKSMKKEGIYCHLIVEHKWHLRVLAMCLVGIYVMVNIWLKVALSKFQCGIIFEQSIPLHLPDKDNWKYPYCKYMERVQKHSWIESIYWYK